MANDNIRGAPVRVFSFQQANALSDAAVDARNFNAVDVTIIVNGTTPSATISLERSDERGGQYSSLATTNPATSRTVTTDLNFTATVPSGWIKVRVAGISGTFGAGLGYTIIVTPFMSAGETNITVHSVADVNLSKYGGTAVGAANPLDVQPGTGVTFAGTVADGSDVTQGATTDTPFVGAETATARTAISLLKGIKNTVYDALGAAADAIVAAGAAGSISAKLRRATQGLEDLKTLIVLAAGTNIIGAVGIDQTTPGTTNAVAVTTIGGATAVQIAALSVNPAITDIGITVKSVLLTWDGTNAVKINGGDTNSDTLIATGNASNSRSQRYGFNGVTWDRWRTNMDRTILASAARTASINSADQVNYNGRGLHLVIDVTAVTATPSIVVTIQGKDALSGQYYTILASAAITAVGTTVLRVYPNLTAAANLTINDVLPRTWRVSVVNDDADSITYSIGASIIL